VVNLDIDTQAYEDYPSEAERFLYRPASYTTTSQKSSAPDGFSCCCIFGDIFTADGQAKPGEASQEPIKFSNLRTAVFYSNSITHYQYGGEFHESYTLLCGSGGKSFRTFQANDCSIALAFFYVDFWSKAPFQPFKISQ
jgi:hypothetical protein